MMQPLLGALALLCVLLGIVAVVLAMSPQFSYNGWGLLVGGAVFVDLIVTAALLQAFSEILGHLRRIGDALPGPGSPSSESSPSHGDK